MATELHVSGLADLQKLLNTLPAKLEANVLRGAFRAGAKLIEAEARALAPVGPPNRENVKLYGGYAGALRDSIRVTTRSRRGVVSASVKAGGKNKKTKADVFYAHMIEYGTKAHNIPAAKGGWISFGGIFSKNIKHPGIKAQKFMRPPLDTQAGAAVNAAAQYMRKSLQTKHGLDTADIKLEGDE